MPTRCNRGFYCRCYCLLNMFRGPLCPSSGAQEYLYSGCCLWYLLLWFSSCWSGVELRVMCPACRMLESRFLLQVLLLALHVSGTTLPIIRSSRVFIQWLLPVVLLWFSSCWSSVELRVMCTVSRMLAGLPQAASTV